MKGYPDQPDYPRDMGELRIEEKEFETGLEFDNFIFLGSATDMWAVDVLPQWIGKVLAYCRTWRNNQYLFQSKNPARFYTYKDKFPEYTTLCTTLESNRDYPELTEAPNVEQRIEGMEKIKGIQKSVTIEPIMEFDLYPFLEMIERIGPEWVNLGADSKGHKLAEPSGEKIRILIEKLEKFTTVIGKKNLRRLL